MRFAGCAVCSGVTWIASDSVAVEETVALLDACSDEDCSGSGLGAEVLVAVVTESETWFGSRSPINPMAQTRVIRVVFFPTAGFY